MTESVTSPDSAFVLPNILYMMEKPTQVSCCQFTGDRVAGLTRKQRLGYLPASRAARTGRVFVLV